MIATGMLMPVPPLNRHSQPLPRAVFFAISDGKKLASPAKPNRASQPPEMTTARRHSATTSLLTKALETTPVSMRRSMVALSDAPAGPGAPAGPAGPAGPWPGG